MDSKNSGAEKRHLTWKRGHSKKSVLKVIICVDCWELNEIREMTLRATGCSEKIVFFHNSQQPLPRLHRWSLLETLKALNAEQVYSHSYWLEIFCTTNSSRVLARERRQTFENSWKKTQYLMNTLYYQAWGNAWPAWLLCCVSDFRIREGQEGRVGVGRNQLWRHSASKDSRSTWYDKYSVQTMDIGEDYFPENKKEVKNVHRSIRHSVNAI